MSVMARSTKEQQDHDRAIEDIALLYLGYDRLVLTNPGNARQAAVGRAYPDLVVKERVPAPEARREPRILLVGEVETASTVSLEEAATWRGLSRLGAPFALYVPQGLLDQAERLVEEQSLSGVALWGYAYVFGRIRLTASQLITASSAANPAGAQHTVPLRPTESA